MPIEKKAEKLSATEVKAKVAELMERRMALLDFPQAFVPGYNPALEITKEFEKLAKQTGVSTAALEFLNNPTGLIGRGATNLSEIENEIEDLNVEWATELKKAGLL